MLLEYQKSIDKI